MVAVVTVADALDVAPLRDGLPVVLVGGTALEHPVRWAHVSDSERIAALLEGGELLLTTGAGWPGDAAGLRSFVRTLAEARAAGIILELGTRFPAPPSALKSSCQEHGLALVVLHREVRFVSVTEAVHRRIIATQLRALQARQEVHDLFTALSLRGAPAETVIRETARLLTAPVVLENGAGEVVALAAAGAQEAEALSSWTGGGWPGATVEARGTRWGRLRARPGAVHPAGVRTVLETAATALALGRLADGDDRAWERAAATMLVRSLLEESAATPADAQARLEAGGFPVRGRRLRALVIRGADAALLDRVAAARPDGTAARSARVGADGVVLLSVPRDHASDAIGSWVGAVRLILGHGAGGGAKDDRAAALGAEATAIEELAASLRSARILAARAQAGTVVRADGRPLTRLAAQLHGDRRLAAFSADLLAPLEAWDRDRDGDLLPVLAALVAHPASRTAAAAAAGLSRSVFYQRLALISDLTGADLDDGEAIAALHLALLTRA